MLLLFKRNHACSHTAELKLKLEMSFSFSIPWSLVCLVLPLLGRMKYNFNSLKLEPEVEETGTAEKAKRKYISAKYNSRCAAPQATL